MRDIFLLGRADLKIWSKFEIWVFCFYFDESLRTRNLTGQLEQVFPRDIRTHNVHIQRFCAPWPQFCTVMSFCLSYKFLNLWSFQKKFWFSARLFSARFILLPGEKAKQTIKYKMNLYFLKIDSCRVVILRSWATFRVTLFCSYSRSLTYSVWLLVN